MVTELLVTQIPAAQLAPGKMAGSRRSQMQRLPATMKFIDAAWPGLQTEMEVLKKLNPAECIATLQRLNITRCVRAQSTRPIKLLVVSKNECTAQLAGHCLEIPWHL